MKLDISQIAPLAAAAGFSGDDLTTAVAIALAESGGDPQAYNPERAANTPQGYGSFGLWQIYLKAHPEYKGQNLFDPQLNASAAFAVYRAAGASFRPWSTFGNGMYLAHVDAVNAAINPPADVVASSSSDGGDGGDGSGSPPPTSGDLMILAVAGAIALWGASRLFG